MWLWLASLGLAADIPLVVLSERPGTPLVTYDRAREIRSAEPVCRLPCKLTLPEGTHKLAVVNPKGRPQAMARLKLGEQTAQPVVLEHRTTRTWALVTYAVLQVGAGVSLAAAGGAGQTCFLYEPGGALADSGQLAQCRSEGAADRALGLAAFGAFQATAIPALMVALPSVRILGGKRRERALTIAETMPGG